MGRYISISLLILVALAFDANGATLDFSVFPQGYQGTTTLTLPEATITGYGTDLYVGAAGIAKLTSKLVLLA